MEENGVGKEGLMQWFLGCLQGGELDFIAQECQATICSDKEAGLLTLSQAFNH